MAEKFRDIFNNELAEAQNGAAYKNYLEIREKILNMLDSQFSAGFGASAFWSEELEDLKYMLDASPLIIEKLRRQCYHLTGLRAFEYAAHHAHRASLMAEKLKALKAKDKRSLLVPESPLMGGFGFNIGGALYNIDTLKFYESLLCMDKAGILDGISKQNTIGRAVVLEIGAGWGGFAYQFKKLFPRVSYVVVDFPLVLLFSATYLKTLFPEARILFVDGKNILPAGIKVEDYDFVFCPHFYWEKLDFKRPDLVFNTVSFQEMTSEQVDGYVKKSKDWGVPYVYSLNRDRSPHNTELTSVGDILRKYYFVKELEVLPQRYHELKIEREKSLWRVIFSGLKLVLKRAVGRNDQYSIHKYRHLIGYE